MLAEKMVHIQVKTESRDVDLPITFGNQIVPIFIKFGCNSGGCHGKASGRTASRCRCWASSRMSISPGEESPWPMTVPFGMDKDVVVVVWGEFGRGRVSTVATLAATTGRWSIAPQCSVIKICLAGGPCHHDMWDLEPGAPQSTRRTDLRTLPARGKDVRQALGHPLLRLRR